METISGGKNYDGWLEQLHLRGYDARNNPPRFRDAFEEGLGVDEFIEVLESEIAQAESVRKWANTRMNVVLLVLAVLAILIYWSFRIQ